MNLLWTIEGKDKGKSKFHFRGLGRTELQGSLLTADYTVIGDRILDSSIYHSLPSAPVCFAEHTWVIPLTSLKQK